MSTLYLAKTKNKQKQTKTNRQKKQTKGQNNCSFKEWDLQKVYALSPRP